MMNEKTIDPGTVEPPNQTENIPLNFSIDNVRIQKFISEFSVPFTQPYDFDVLIDNALFELRDFTVTDRAIILEFQSDGSLVCTHENVINDETPRVLGRLLEYNMKKPIFDEADKTGCFYEKEAARYFRQHPNTDLGEKSFCYIPLTIGGVRAGYLVFFTMFEQANWTEGEFRLATMAGSIIAGAYSRKKSEEVLLAAKEAELRTQEFMSKFSVPFTQPYDFDELIDNALFELRDFTVTDRAIILEYQLDGSLLCTHENRINEETPKVLGRSLEHETMRPILVEADRTGCYYEKVAIQIFEKHIGTSLDEKSFCYIPLTIGGSRAGYLVFFTMFEQANWAEGEFRLATMAGSIIAGAYSRKKSEDVLFTANKEELRTQEFISKFAVPFTQSYEFDELIDNALYELRSFTNTDRAIILELQPEGSLLCTHENRINEETPKVLGRSLRYETMRPILNEADRTGCYYEKAAVQIFKKHPGTSMDEKSFCYIPLTIGGSRAGYLVFFTMFEQANWAEGEFRLATMAGSIIVGAYSRKKSDEALFAANAEELRAQEFISKFSVPFTQPYDFDELIDNALYELRNFTHTDRAIILEFQPDGSLLCSYENRINKETPEVLGRLLQYESMKPILDEANRTGCFYIKEAIGYFSKYPKTDLDEKSFCYIPLMVEGTRAGYLVFFTIFEQANWAEGEFKLVSMAGSILAGAFSMRKGENALKEATLTAQQASIAKSQFLSNMSHEIRTPMNAILGMTQIAGRTLDIEKLKQCIETIEVSSNQLMSLINDILDISKIESGKLMLNEMVFSLERTIIRACALVITKANEKKIKLRINTDDNLHLRYRGDEIRVSQILANLLANAVKFTPHGGLITVTAREVDHPDKYKTLIRIIVEDTGIGMTEEHLSRVFNSFEQADGSTSRKYGGTGLGLTITKSLAEMMDGNIEVESKHGVGSKFTVTISLGRANTEEYQVYNVIKTQFSELNLLLISNTEGVSSKFTNLVNRFGLRCDKANTFADAMILLQTAHEHGWKYNAVFIDFSLHYDEASRIYPSIIEYVGTDAIVFISEYGEKDRLIGEIGSYGFNRYIEMPLFASPLYDTLMSIVYDKMTNGVGNESSGKACRFLDVTVLYAEDVKVNRDVFMDLLDGTGIRIDYAENGEAAVEKFRESPNKYDMVLMDVQMPKMNGLDATQTIRSLDIPHARTIPIVAMTAHAFKEDIDECLDAGMDDHLAKPINIQNMYSIFIKWLPENKRVSEDADHGTTLDQIPEQSEDKKNYLMKFAQILPDEWPDFDIAMKNPETIRQELHRIKGVAGNISEKDVYRCAVDFENSLRNHEPDRTLYERFVEACSAVKREAVKQCATPESNLSETGMFPEFIELLDALRQALLESDPAASSDITNILKKKEWPFIDRIKLHELYEFTQIYDFDNALVIIGELEV